MERKGTFISSVSPYPEEEYYLGKSSWSATASDWDQRFEVGDVVADPSGSWTPSTAEAYIDQQVATITGNLANETIARQTADQSLQTQINAEVTTRANTDTSLQNQISTEANTRSTADEQLRILYENLTQSDIVVGPRPSSGQLTNVIYREPDQTHTPPQNYSDYMWYNSAWVLMATYDNAIDNEPTPNSDNLVKSGGVSNKLDTKPQIFLFSGSNNYINLITNQSSLKLELPNVITGVFGNSIEAIPGGVYDVEFSVFSNASNCFLVYNRTDASFLIRVGRILKDDYIIAAIRNNATITSATTNLDIQTYKPYCLDVALNDEFKSDRYMAKTLMCRNADFEATAIRIAATSMIVVIDNVNYIRCGNSIKKLEAGNYPINISYCDKQKTDYILCVNESASDADRQNVFYLIPNAYYSSQNLPQSFFVICILTTDEPLTTSSTSMNVVTINKDILVNRKLLSYAQQEIDINNEELRNSNKYIRRISGKYSYILAHFAGGGMLADHPISTQGGNNRYLPEYSITNVILAKQMGFDGVGLNVHSTSDGVLVCCHDDTINRTFRNKTDYSSISGDVAIASNTYAQLAENYVCETQIERLRGAILKLEDVIIICKNINLGIAIIPDGSIMTAVANLMQKYDFSDWMFIGNWRPAGCSGNVMYITPANKTADEIIVGLNVIGKPASCLFETTALQSYTDAQILEIAEACHKAGYGVGVDTYASKEEIQKFRNWGCFDITSVDNEIPSFENGNYISLSSVADFSEFSCSNEGTIVTGILPAGGTISYYNQDITKDFVAATLKIQYEGTIRLVFGQGYTNQEVDVDFSSDGSKEEVFTNIFFDEQVGFTITALGSVNIKNIKFDAKK